MNKYELVYVIDVNLEDEARKAVIDRFNGMIEQNGGKVTKVEDKRSNVKPRPVRVAPAEEAAAEAPAEAEAPAAPAEAE